MTTFTDNLAARRAAMLAAACIAEEAAGNLLAIGTALRRQAEKLQAVELSPPAVRSESTEVPYLTRT